MKRLTSLLLLIINTLIVYAQSGSTGYGYGYEYCDTVEVVEVIEVVEAIDSLDYVDYSLIDVIKPRDWDRLVLDREQALEVLDRLPSYAYGLDEKTIVKKLLTTPNLKITSQELLSYRKVRSIQVSNLGIFSYPYFSCRFRKKDGKIFFEKTTGSQRKSGYIYDNKPDSKVFLGGWSVNDDPQTSYQGENSVCGMVYKIGSNKLIMLFLAPDEKSFEIYELTK
ncbi:MULTISPECIES: DUF4893 domain-containing protein [Bacteroides]|uniref:DUF4893 domain-containing protein n=1 Tax=Bacteroides TaxID=816 RepID=UPI0026473EFF|nr:MULTISPECIES: DUF4893 domain-containing protein [Bacteroides]